MPLAMPPAMTDLLDIWAAHSPLAGHALDQITVDFLLPTGIYIQMDVPREATIQHIKLVSGTGSEVISAVLSQHNTYCKTLIKSTFNALQGDYIY